MIKKSLKTLGILKVFQFLLAFLCVSAPITETQALCGWFKGKKKSKKKSRDKKDVSDQKKQNKRKVKIRITNKKNRNRVLNQKITNKKNRKKENENTAAHSKKIVSTGLSAVEAQNNSNKIVEKFLKSIGAKSINTPSLESLRNNSAKALRESMHFLLPPSQFYDYPTSEGAIVTVPLKPLKTIPLIGSSSKEFIDQVILFLADSKFNPKLEGFISNLEHSIKSIRQEQKVFKEKLLKFMELHKKYQDPKKCKLNFEESKFGILLDSSKKIASWVNGMKKSNPQDDQQNCKNYILRELNTIERILGDEETKEKRETVQVQKVMYERPKSQEPQDQSKDHHTNMRSLQQSEGG